MRKEHSQDEIVFCLSDLKTIFSHNRKKIWGFALICSCLCFALLMLTPLKYEAVATFSEIPEKKESLHLFKDLFSANDASNGTNKAEALMKLRPVLEPVIEKYGLQVSCFPKKKNIFFRVLRRYFQNLKGEFGYKIQDLDTFSFEKVSFQGPLAKQYYLVFLTKEKFQILNGNRKILTEGTVKKPVCFDNIQMTIAKTAKKMKKNTPYTLLFHPIGPGLAKIKKNLKIQPSKLSNSILYLTYCDRDRFLAKNILNALMDSYVDYLKLENELFAKHQFQYLEKRQDEVSQKFEKTLAAHSKYLADNLQKKGFIGLDQEIYSLISPHTECLKKFFAADLELTLIGEFSQDNPNLLAGNAPLGKEFVRIADEKEKLLQKKDMLSMGLISKSKGMYEALDERIYQIDLELKKLGYSTDLLLPPTSQELVNEKMQLENALQKKTYHNCIDKHFIYLSNIRKQKKEIEDLLEKMQIGESLKHLSFSKNPGSLVKLWVEKILQNETLVQDQSLFTKEDLSHYLKQHHRILSMQENVFNERAFFLSESQQMLEGIDLDTSRELYVSYNHKIDQTQAMKKHFQHLLKKMGEQDFEVSSLGSILKDGVSQGFIQNAATIRFKLNDQKNLSNKDEMRLKEEMSLIRKFLKMHIEQMLHLNDIQEKLYKDKIYALQLVSLDSTNQQISILDQQTKDYLILRKASLTKEKEVLDQQMKHLREKMKHLPQKWELEKKLKLQSDITLKMIQSLTSLIETKTIEHHLKQIGSKPIELAELPLIPKSKRGRFLFVLSFTLGILFSFVYWLIKALNEGFIATLENLQAIGQNAMGEISFACDGPNIKHIPDSDLETIRNIIHFSDPLLDKPASVLGLIGNTGPNYGHCLAHLIGKIGKKALLIDLDFRVIHKKSEGLIQYLEKKLKEIPLQKFDLYDYLVAGATTRFGSEILRSSTFQQFLKDLKGKYDIIVVFGRVCPMSSEAKAYLRFSDKTVITFLHETLQKLSSFFQKDGITGFLKIQKP